MWLWSKMIIKNNPSSDKDVNYIALIPKYRFTAIFNFVFSGVATKVAPELTYQVQVDHVRLFSVFL